MTSTDNERSMVKAVLEEIGWLELTSLPGVVETGEGFEEHITGHYYVQGFRTRLPGFKFKFHPLLVI